MAKRQSTGLRLDNGSKTNGQSFQFRFLSFRFAVDVNVGLLLVRDTQPPVYLFN